MNKATKEMLKKIISNQELIMKHLNVKKTGEELIAPKTTIRKKATKRSSEKKSPSKKKR